ncbi:hypothetical protein [Finegoldia sp. BIOML-A1]|uniref:hypothetical protein n=1 Tax=Finegoldia sp. BIOML-A1 TaxID=2584649 RepID=UPI0012B1531A|nr:hypothetical protein [Finegoldia sp. BIOML-A1]MSB11633.1 hypothetical protein [Finegoldia sp. BIOML-A1]
MMEVESTVELNEDVKEKLIELDKSHLDKLNPYGLEKIGDEETYPELDKIIKQFLEYHKGNADGVFSWVKELNKLAEEKKGKKILYVGDSANQHYGLPTHVNGDYKNGLIYHCLFNAGTNGVEDSLKISENSLYDYYKIPEKEPGKGPKDINDIIFESEEGKIVENLRHNIIGPDSLLTKELINERKGAERGYYCKTYYKEILEKNEDFYFDLDEKISEKTNNLVNIELYPLRSKNKKGAGYKINKFSLFGAYIILYRIGKYLNEVDSMHDIQKPRFIFRSFTEWEECIKAAIRNYFNFDDDNDKTDELFEYLYDNFFLEFSSPNAGSVSSVNVVKKVRIGNERFDKMIDCLSDPEK